MVHSVLQKEKRRIWSFNTDKMEMWHQSSQMMYQKKIIHLKTRKIYYLQESYFQFKCIFHVIDYDQWQAWMWLWSGQLGHSCPAPTGTIALTSAFFFQSKTVSIPLTVTLRLCQSFEEQRQHKRKKSVATGFTTTDIRKKKGAKVYWQVLEQWKQSNRRL